MEHRTDKTHWPRVLAARAKVRESHASTSGSVAVLRDRVATLEDALGLSSPPAAAPKGK